MTKLEIFDPPMCCSTGICGNSDDPTLVTFASDIEWLKKQGVDVLRHSLALQPAEFALNKEVKEMLNKEGNGCLPILFVDGKLVSKVAYPSREKLSKLCNVEFNNEEAPPIHREENCCCGVDCDCRTSNIPESIKDTCDCTNAPAESNCFCSSQETYQLTESNNNNQKIIFIVIFLIVLGFLSFKFCCKTGDSEINHTPQTVTIERPPGVNK